MDGGGGEGCCGGGGGGVRGDVVGGDLGGFGEEGGIVSGEFERGAGVSKSEKSICIAGPDYSR